MYQSSIRRVCPRARSIGNLLSTSCVENLTPTQQLRNIDSCANECHIRRSGHRRVGHTGFSIRNPLDVILVSGFYCANPRVLRVVRRNTFRTSEIKMEGGAAAVDSNNEVPNEETADARRFSFRKLLFKKAAKVRCRGPVARSRCIPLESFDLSHDPYEAYGLDWTERKASHPTHRRSRRMLRPAT